MQSNNRNSDIINSTPRHLPHIRLSLPSASSTPDLLFIPASPVSSNRSLPATSEEGDIGDHGQEPVSPTFTLSSTLPRSNTVASLYGRRSSGSELPPKTEPLLSVAFTPSSIATSHNPFSDVDVITDTFLASASVTDHGMHDASVASATNGTLSDVLPRGSMESSYSDLADERRRRRTSRDVMESLALDRFRKWMVCFCIVNFDLELGQAMDFVYPPVEFTEQEKKNICFSAFPDSNVFEVGDTVYNFRIRSNSKSGFAASGQLVYNFDKPSQWVGQWAFVSVEIRKMCGEASGQAGIIRFVLDACDLFTVSNALAHTTGPTADAGFLYGYVFFRQKKDPRIRRGYFQKSIVLVSQHPYVGLFSRLISILGPAFCDVGKPMLEAACHNIASWYEDASTWPVFRTAVPRLRDPSRDPATPQATAAGDKPVRYGSAETGNADPRLGTHRHSLLSLQGHARRLVAVLGAYAPRGTSGRDGAGPECVQRGRCHVGGYNQPLSSFWERGSTNREFGRGTGRYFLLMMVPENSQRRRYRIVGIIGHISPSKTRISNPLSRRISHHRTWYSV
ncbi:LOW QUALITY PROTEIN: hypothetical protein BC936DRAFT_140479 [Jimgerdemannia flammicorona]|uniref:UDENN domain-containing protein n=1 Tax=Jimgerdemannia flammicorona TaxID=994334 RepID=A0A433DGV3_9FUNG|nr:LOW QUALITY PROTEIN: hypothetical protein BC936DRAFT_140479 [Jimgerdemannia flammicorona]